jgi:hypothetical protein
MKRAQQQLFPSSGVQTPEIDSQIQAWCGFSHLIFINKGKVIGRGRYSSSDMLHLLTASTVIKSCHSVSPKIGLNGI